MQTMTKTKGGRFVWYVAPLLLWMGFIFYMSTDRGSVENTSPTMTSILRLVLPSVAERLTPEQLYRVEVDIRKTGHVTEYTLLAILAFRVVAWGSPRLGSRHVILPWLITLMYAVSDEYHQSFVPSRDGAAGDVFIDNTGALAGTLLCLWQHLVRHPAKRS